VSRRIANRGESKTNFENVYNLHNAAPASTGAVQFAMENLSAMEANLTKRYEQFAHDGDR
jgi:hypothetical protein